MPTGILLNDGQNHILNVLFGASPVQNYYLGLMTNLVNPSVTDQIGSGITEVTGTGYARLLLTRNTNWTIAGPLALSHTKTFTVGAGGWADVGGFFIAQSLAGIDAILAQPFDGTLQRSFTEGEQLEVEVQIQLKDNSESCGTPPPGEPAYFTFGIIP